MRATHTVHAKMRPVFAKMRPIFAKMRPIFAKMRPIFAKMRPIFSKGLSMVSLSGKGKRTLTFQNKTCTKKITASQKKKLLRMRAFHPTPPAGCQTQIF